MTPQLTFSIRLNNDLLITDYQALAIASEKAGFDQFWVSNDLFFRSAPVILASVAPLTQRISLGTCILNPYSIDASEIAMFAASMDELTGNRFNLGIAAGARDFLSWVGIEQRTPLSAVRESVRMIRNLLSGEIAACEGRFLRWSDNSYLRFPANRVTPIYVGAMSTKMIRLAGELGDGALPLLFPPEHWKTVKPLLEEGIRKRDQSMGQLDFAACIWASLSEDKEKARRCLARKIAYYGPHLSTLILDRLSLTKEDFKPVERALASGQSIEDVSKLVDERMLKIGVTGGPKDIIRRLEPLVEAGIRHLSFGPPLGPDPIEAVSLLGHEVLPYFRSK